MSNSRMRSKTNFKEGEVNMNHEKKTLSQLGASCFARDRYASCSMRNGLMRSEIIRLVYQGCDNQSDICAVVCTNNRPLGEQIVGAIGPDDFQGEIYVTLPYNTGYGLFQVVNSPVGGLIYVKNPGNWERLENGDTVFFIEGSHFTESGELHHHDSDYTASILPLLASINDNSKLAENCYGLCSIAGYVGGIADADSYIGLCDKIITPELGLIQVSRFYGGVTAGTCHAERG